MKSVVMNPLKKSLISTKALSDEHHEVIRLLIQAFLMMSVNYLSKPMRQKCVAIKKGDLVLTYKVDDVKLVEETALKSMRCIFYQMSIFLVKSVMVNVTTLKH